MAKNTAMKLLEKIKNKLSGTSKTDKDNFTDEEILNDPVAVQYINSGIQSAAHHIFLQYISDDDSVLDVGCGRGDFYITWKHITQSPVNYLGIDINPRLVSAAAKKTSGVPVIELSYDQLSEDHIRDWVITDMINYDYNNVENKYDYLVHVLNKMVATCKKGVIILLATTKQMEDDKYLYYDPALVLTHCLTAYKDIALPMIDHTIADNGCVLFLKKHETI
jgi:SAM-dependent methyltransferase